MMWTCHVRFATFDQLCMSSLKLYVASHSKDQALQVASRLRAHGHIVTSRWIDFDSKFGHGISQYTDDEREALALMDEEDVHSAEDGLVLVAESEGRTVPGGKHVETGIALGLGRLIFVLGRRENVFHWHPRVSRFDNLEALVEALESIKDTTGPSRRR
jgi:hypothetical protein